jgi:hypothetical protein
MKHVSYLVVLGLTAGAGAAAAQTPAAQIAAAVLAAPEDRRAGARVLGWDAAGKLVTLREGTNDMICLGDDPRTEGFESNCYHVSLEPYMARGRELLAQGITGDRNQIRWKEVQEGKLRMPEKPAILYTLTGTRYDAATGKLEEAYRRSTLYAPFATTESTGLSTKASTTDPWIMFPGTAGAHIMITPPRPARSGGAGT